MDSFARQFLKDAKLEVFPAPLMEQECFYAARHAVLAIDVGINVKNVYLSSDDTGMCEFQPVSVDFANQEIVNLVAMYIAGAHGCFPARCCGAALETFRQAFESSPLDLREQIVANAVQKSKELIMRCQRHIHPVADAIRNAPERKLSGHEVMQIVRGLK